MARRAAELAANPQVAKLLQDPQLLQQALGADPNLKRLLDQSPEIMRLMQPEKLQQVLLMSKDPHKLLAGTGDQVIEGDLSSARKVCAVKQAASHTHTSTGMKFAAS